MKANRPRVRRRRWLRPLFYTVAGIAITWLVSLVLLRFFDPPFTAVHSQRRLESVFSSREYRKAYTPVPLSRITADLQHAVIAAEDGRFYQHSGIDWKQVELVAEEARETGEVRRGASTITQQLIKNLYFSTHRNPARKIFEWVMAPVVEAVLGKRRVLELYLNVAEWGPGVYGAEAAARYYFGVPASRLTRQQSARLAAILPAPLRRKPAKMDRYTGIILTRMTQMGW